MNNTKIISLISTERLNESNKLFECSESHSDKCNEVNHLNTEEVKQEDDVLTFTQI